MEYLSILQRLNKTWNLSETTRNETRCHSINLTYRTPDYIESGLVARVQNMAAEVDQADLIQFERFLCDMNFDGKISISIRLI